MSNARIVILFLGSLALVSLGGVIYLTANGQGIPDVLVGTVSGSLSALGAILAKTSSDVAPVTTGGPTTVNVEGERGAVDIVTALVVVILVVVLLVLLGVLR